MPSIKTDEIESEDAMAMAQRKSPGRFPLNRSVSADPNLNDPKIQAKIGNRQIKTINKTIGRLLYKLCNCYQ